MLYADLMENGNEANRLIVSRWESNSLIPECRSTYRGRLGRFGLSICNEAVWDIVYCLVLIFNQRPSDEVSKLICKTVESKATVTFEAKL